MVSVIVPTYNASSYLPLLLTSLRGQTQPHELILIDSESDEETQRLLSSANANIVHIKKSEFNHGATRNLGLKLAMYDTVVFLTQDALPVSNKTLQQLVDMLYSQDSIAMAYGRQLPYSNTGVFGRFARIMNYPKQSLIKTRDMIPYMGIKTCSCSNSFAVYRKADLLAIGGFPTDTILGEDVSVAARFILQGKAVAYCAEAEVFHSHNYSLMEEFKRYFDIGVFHQEQKDVLNKFTQAETEGFKYIVEEWNYLRRNKHLDLVPEQIIRTIVKYLGYRLGRWEKHIPIYAKRKISMHSLFWK